MLATVCVLKLMSNSMAPGKRAQETMFYFPKDRHGPSVEERGRSGRSSFLHVYDFIPSFTCCCGCQSRHGSDAGHFRGGAH